MTTLAKKKAKKFGMHPKLLMDVITRQSGTLTKAIMEGVMNSVDAKASNCRIDLSEDTLIIEDDGQGFPTEDQVDRCFNTFGQPHDANERKTYGNFRMGRGQMFAFGRNVWESLSFQFDVDIKARGTDWDFYDNVNTGVDGCRVTIHLYDRLSLVQMSQIKRELEQFVKWFSIPVVFNDEQISQNPAEHKWDYESERCYVKLKTTGGLKVYNLGAFVMELAGHRYGRGGEVVSREQLKLNMARNDVLESCPVWKEVRKFVEEAAGREISKRGSLNDQERQSLADHMKAHRGQADHEMRNLRLFTDVNGKHWSIKSLNQATYKFRKFSHAPKGHRRGQVVHNHSLAFVFAVETLERFDFEHSNDLVRMIRRLSPHFSETWEFAGIEEVAPDLNEDYLLVEPDEYSEIEKCWIELAHTAVYHLQNGIAARESATIRHYETRKIMLGTSRVADAWTDGGSYIAVSREYLKTLTFGDTSDLVRLAQLLTHELCSDTTDAGMHEHDAGFYEQYHDCHDEIAMTVEKMQAAVPRVIERFERKATRAELNAQDKANKLAAAKKQLQELS